MDALKTNYPTLATESFGRGRKHYFIDVKRAANDSHFVLITSSEQFTGDEKRYRKTIQLWEEDLAMFVEALSMILRQLAHGQLNAQTKMELVEPERRKSIGNI